MRWILSFIFVVLFIGLPLEGVRANPTKEFITSCTYGVLTGTLVGAATLAFRDQPGDNLQAVARGASLGLYLGIALGIYVTQVVPNQGSDLENELLEGVDQGQVSPKFYKAPLVYIEPTFSKHNRPDGLIAQFQVLRF